MPTEAPPALKKNQLLSLFRQMVLIRRCEEQLARSHQRGLIHGACHTYVGQEAIAVGVCAHLRPEDVVFSTHRGHGHALAKGVPPRQLIAELFGRATGCSHGRGGSMHLFAPEVGLMGTSGIVGPCILQAAGAGYSFKLLEDRPRGRGLLRRRGRQQRGLPRRAEHGQPSGSCRSCSSARTTSTPPRCRSSYAAGNPSVAGAGRLLRPARRRGGRQRRAGRVTRRPARPCAARAPGGGPTLLECKTYRTRPHAEGMGDFTYRTREEVEELEDAAARSRGSEARCSMEAVAGRRRTRRDRGGGRGADRRGAPLRRAEPLARPGHGGRRTSTPRADEPIAGAARARRRRRREITYMQATLEALSEEMAQNPTIFVLGEGIGKRGGNFSTTAGLYDLLRPRAALRHADLRARLRRPRRRRRHDRHPAGHRLHVRRLRPRRASARSSTRSPRCST